MFKGLYAKLYTVGAFLLTVAAMVLRLQVLKNQRDKAVQTADVLKARAITAKAQKKIKREEEKKLVSHKAEIVKELNKEKEEFEGIASLKDSNDF